MARPGAIEEDYYSILHVSQAASDEAIRESYKRLALKFHPDKNRDDLVAATIEFQKLGRAWEVLRDVGKRREYDRDYVGIKRRWCEEQPGGGNAKKRWRDCEEDDRGMSWEDGRGAASKRRQSSSKRVRVWREGVRRDYSSRLQQWSAARKRNLDLAIECQSTIQRNEMQLQELKEEEEEDVIQRFRRAIEQSQSTGQQIHDPDLVLRKLMAARKGYEERLAKTIADFQRRFHELSKEMEADGRRFEEDTAVERQKEIPQALDIIHSQSLNPLLFNALDRRLQASNHWKALARIKPPARFFVSLTSKHEGEGPWHYFGEWESVEGDHSCGRCAGSVFSVVPEWGPKRCPGCEMVVCGGCWRDLRLLREFEDWVVGVGGRLFEVEFGDGLEAGEEWNGPGINNGPDSTRESDDEEDIEEEDD